MGNFDKSELNIHNKQSGGPWAILISKRLHGKATQSRDAGNNIPVFWSIIKFAAILQQNSLSSKQCRVNHVGVYKLYRMLQVFLI